MDEVLICGGGSVKALEGGKVEGFLVVFSDENSPDISEFRDYFDVETDFDIEAGAKSAVYYEHGLDSTLKRRKLGRGTMEIKDAGVWIDAQLNLRDEYEKAVYELAQKNKLGWSSGTAPNLVERERKSNGSHHVKHWPLGIDASLTPQPAEPRTSAITSIKSYRAQLGLPPRQSLPVKGLLKDKLAEQTPSWWQLQDILREVLKDIANAARASKVTGVELDVTTKVKEVLAEYTEELLPSLVSQIEDFAKDSTSDEYFYIKSSSKSGRRNSARDLTLINTILRAAKELGAEDDEEEPAKPAKTTDAVSESMKNSSFELASLELATL